MVSDGYKYATPLIVVAVFIGCLVNPWWALLPLLPATLLLWFFRDPERIIPGFPGAVVSPADGKVTDISTVPAADSKGKRISIFLSVFDVHVNRSPISGIIRDVRYRRGEFLNAMGRDCAEQNEQNIVTVEGEGHIVAFKQIAGLLARRIVFNKQVGDAVQRGERVGMIKFGSRVDVLLDATATLAVKVGDHVKGGSSVLAYLQPRGAQVAEAGSAAIRNGAR